ncbi:MAG TPA: hypothetical protein VFI34_10050, partial [Candidatus Limnocylindrales bacterium]|nr:hypothetical protein [Candidatus Limnocylindrales bacterium]
MTRRQALVLIVAAIGLVAVTATSWILRPGGVKPPASPPPSGASATPGLGPLSVESVVDGTYDPTSGHDPTASANQAKVWFAHGSWWAALRVPGSPELRIARLDPSRDTWADTGVVIDERPRVRASVVATDDELIVVSAGVRPEPADAPRVTRFAFDPATSGYRIEADTPVSVAPTGVIVAALARDAGGALWLALVRDGRLTVQTSADGRQWSADLAAGFGPPVSGVRTAAIASGAGGATIVAWNQVHEPTLQTATHAAGADAATWTTESTAIPELRDAPGDLALAVAAGTPDPRPLIAFEAVDAPANGSLDAGALVAIRGPGGWSSALLGRVKDHLRAPVLAVDDQHGLVVALAATSDGDIIAKAATLDRPTFDPGPGQVVYTASVTASAGDPSVAAGPADLDRGVLVLAADDKLGTYVHGLVRAAAAGAPTPTPSPTPAPSGASGPPPSTPPGQAPSSILRIAAFDAWPVDTPIPTWVVSGQGRGRGGATVVALPSAQNHSLRVATTSRAGSVRACLSVPPTATGDVTVSALVRVQRAGGSDTVLASVRGPGGEVASLRATRRGEVAWFAGATKRVGRATI